MPTALGTAEDHIKIPPPDKEFLEGEAFKAQEEAFKKSMFDTETKPQATVTDPDITFPEEKKEEPPKEEPKAEEPKKEEPPKEEPKVEDPPKEEPKADDTDALLPGGKKDEPKPAEPAKEEPKVAQPAVIDADDLAARVAEKLKPQQPKPTPEPDPLAAFSDEDKAQLRVLQHLQKTNPKYKNKDLVKETVNFWNAEMQYIAQWEKNNPGETFDKDDKAHENFYSKHEPELEPTDLEEARIDIRVQERLDARVGAEVEKRMAPLQQQVRETTRKQVEAAADPIIKESQAKAVAVMAAQAVPEFQEILKDGKLTTEAVAAMREKDPAALQAINREARVVNVLVREVERLAHMGEHFTYDPAMRESIEGGVVVRPHTEIAAIFEDVEESIAKGPKEGKIRDGRIFAPRVAFDRALTEAEAAGDQNRVNAILNRFWIVGPDDVKQEIVRRSAEKVKGYLEVANSRGAATPKNDAGKDANGDAKKNNPKPASKSIVNPPSTASASDITDTKIPKAPGAESPEKIVDRAMFG